jgi:glycerol kinase
MGLTRGTSRAHLARAALEAMAYQSDEVLQAMRQASGIAIATLRVDGGASESELLMQFQANLSGVRIERPTNLETTAWGAAALAGLQVGVFRSLEEVAAVHRLRDSFSPTLHETEREQRRHRWAEATRRSRNWVV